MHFHIVGLPHTRFDGNFPMCAFTGEIERFSRMMSARGHKITVYGAGDKGPAGADFVSVISQQEQDLLGCGKHYTQASWDASAPLWRTFNRNATQALRANLYGSDFRETFVLLTGGSCQKIISDRLDTFGPHGPVLCVEWAVGYNGSFAEHRVFRSYAWQHASYGVGGTGKFFDAVIPGFLDFEDFRLYRESDNPGTDYAIFVGRLNEDKGLRIAEEATRAAGMRLLVLGEGPLRRESAVGDDVVFIGEKNHEERNAFMQFAKALICPTTYIEPFGYVAIEAQMMGTPVVSTDWGGFVETVEEGVSGFRCRTLHDFKRGLLRASFLDRAVIRSRAESLWSFDAVGPLYDEYFHRLSTLYGRGWYE